MYRSVKLPALLLAGALAPAAEFEDRWRSVANALIRTPVEAYPFNWGEGVQKIGLMKIYRHTRDRRYLDYMERWTAQFLPQPPSVLLNAEGQSRRTHRGYCGHWSPATAILQLYEVRQKPEYLTLARQVNNYILTEAERSSEGALAHWKGNHQLWVDTLYMACPLLAALGRRDRKPEWIDDAARQIILYARYLQDSNSGLFYHMYDWDTRERTPSLWARGNGWVLMSIADTIEVMDRRHRHYAELVSIATRMTAGLARTQNADGLFHTVMDDTSSYPETSATMMFTYGLLKLIRLKALPPAPGAGIALKGWRGVNEKYVRDGVVTGVSAGTEPGRDDNYKARPVGRQTWGTGAYLMAGSEVVRHK